MGKEEKRKGLVITERDIAIFESLSIARFLTAEAIEWLHYPGWKARYAAMQGNEHDYAVTGALYSRLKRLRGIKPSLLYRIIRPVALSYSRFSRDDDVYCLAPGGAHLLARAGKMAIEEIWTERLRTRSAQTLAHSALIGKFYAAIRARLEEAGYELHAWAGDHLISKDYDSVSLIGKRNPSRKDGLWPVAPDAAFFVGQGEQARLFFVEIDRGRPIATWREKVKTYEAYRRGQKLKARYHVENFVVLVATTSEAQRRKMLQATADELQKVNKTYCFTLFDNLHPTKIGQGWKRLETVEAGPLRMVVDRLHTTWKITTADYTLIQG